MKVIFSILLVINFVFTPIFGSEQKDSGYLIDTPEEALKQALEYTGFDRLFDPWGKDSTNVSVFREVASDTSTEYSKKEINGKEIWRVRMNNIVLDLPHTSNDIEIKYPKDIEVAIDAKSGILVEIRGIDSNSEKFNKSLCFLNKAAEPEGDIYYGIPKDRPAVDFLAALGIAKKLIIRAKKIMAIYILYSKSNLYSGNIIPVWVIYSDELPPFEINTPGIKYNNQRIVINAMTGTSYGYSCRSMPEIKYDSAEYKDDNKQDDK